MKTKYANKKIDKKKKRIKDYQKKKNINRNRAMIKENIVGQNEDEKKNKTYTLKYRRKDYDGHLPAEYPKSRKNKLSLAKRAEIKAERQEQKDLKNLNAKVQTASGR